MRIVLILTFMVAVLSGLSCGDGPDPSPTLPTTSSRTMPEMATTPDSTPEASRTSQGMAITYGEFIIHTDSEGRVVSVDCASDEYVLLEVQSQFPEIRTWDGNFAYGILLGTCVDKEFELVAIDAYMLILSQVVTRANEIAAGNLISPIFEEEAQKLLDSGALLEADFNRTHGSFAQLLTRDGRVY